MGVYAKSLFTIYYTYTQYVCAAMNIHTHTYTYTCMCVYVKSTIVLQLQQQLLVYFIEKESDTNKN